MNSRKMVVSDYDGTFYLDDKGIIENVKKVNAYREKDNLFIIATGNNFIDFQKVISKYSIKCDYLISDQGACIFDNNGTLLKSCFLDYEISKKIMYEIKQTNKEYKLCNPYTKAETLEEKNITKMAAYFIDLQEALNFTNKINEKFGEYVNAYTMIFEEINIVEIISSKTDKNEAIKYIIDKENISKSDVYTIGNGYNDISMIQNFNGYCMKNSVDELLKKCQNQVVSVAELIDKLINI